MDTSLKSVKAARPDRRRPAHGGALRLALLTFLAVLPALNGQTIEIAGGMGVIPVITSQYNYASTGQPEFADDLTTFLSLLAETRVRFDTRLPQTVGLRLQTNNRVEFLDRLQFSSLRTSLTFVEAVFQIGIPVGDIVEITPGFFAGAGNTTERLKFRNEAIYETRDDGWAWTAGVQLDVPIRVFESLAVVPRLGYRYFAQRKPIVDNGYYYHRRFPQPTATGDNPPIFPRSITGSTIRYEQNTLFFNILLVWTLPFG